MHQSAFNHIDDCIRQYVDNKRKYKVLDFGSRASAKQHLVHKDLFQSDQYEYIGCDVKKGRNVDLLMRDPYTIPLDNESVDLIVSGQVFEHIPFFWVSFLELARVLRRHGHIFLTAPSRGHIHSHPYDCWRFYPDGYKALAAFANLRLVQIHTDFPPKLANGRLDYSSIPASRYWGDTVGVFEKTSHYAQSELEDLRTVLQRMANRRNDLDSTLAQLGPEAVGKDASIIEHRAFGIRFPFYREIFRDKVIDKMHSGRYEIREATAAMKYVKPRQRVLELGGGLGFLSTLIKLKLDPAAYTVIEADPRLVPLIKQTHNLNGVHGVLVQSCVATSDPETLSKGYAELAIGSTFWGSSVKITRSSKRTIRVDAIPLVTFLENVQPDVLLIDIEGGEADLFNGIEMPTVKLVIVEMHPNVIGDDGVKRIESELLRIGLAPEEFDPATHVGIYSRKVS